MKKPNRWSTSGHIKKRYFSWWSYIATLLCFAIIGGLPGILYVQNWRQIIENSYIGWYLIYWIIVSALFSGVIAVRRYREFERPIRRLSAAAKRVSNGDFSVYLSPVHSVNNYDYLDELFENFNRMVEELGSIETLKNDFVGNVSHEFKAPLAVIQSYAASLQSTNLTEEEKKQYLAAIIQATNNLASLVTNILRLNKLENQAISQKAGVFDLSRQLAECSLQLEDRWETKSIDFEVDLLEKCQIKADQEMLSIVWNNLLTNAIKFTPRHGKIKLQQVAEDDGVQVSVSDSGIGMNSEMVKHIFDQFYQGDTSHSKEGNGLGLAMVQKIVTLSNGTISVHSEEKKGTTFIVWLPKNL
ncbi:HAMP domain-containing sensor histidine kinase [Liquorilactobacillus mali]|uniref:HAMP domain-containing sensor histidine kinase n=1 Tax=Liquorilactobacillus mali TaxID=1618 RepID=UPI00234FD4A2|nr:HAMP domain-containing sensor histidine kinase [Liquorilactobacillus mali]MDC7952834.1 HAMP domain-containing histidine kinase [Liquorilactobacillus mali]